MSKNDVYVEIFHEATDKVERCMGPMALSKAEHVASGAYRNMSDDYSVRIVDEPSKESRP